MSENILNLKEITYKSELNHFQIHGFDSEKSSGIAFEKIDPVTGGVIDVLSEKEVDIVLKKGSFPADISKSDAGAVILRAYEKAAQTNFLNVQICQTEDAACTALSMKKDGRYYRAVLNGKNDNFTVDGGLMSEKEKFVLFYQAQKVLGDKGMQKFGLVPHRNAVIEGTRHPVIKAQSATFMDNALNPMNYLGPECAVPVRE